ncbi:MAG: tail fiber domain-containing protein [Crocinitomicaceae bacterium]|nr:tail fiber domain-containing protein [Crocinitomicaceae bacterium]
MRNVILFVVFVFSVSVAFSQGSVSINTNGDQPDNSAMLDISSTTKGLLIPRMSSVQRSAIGSPANGLMVYDDTTDSFWYYNGSAWTEIGGAGASAPWLTSGNLGTTPGTDFIGTIDNQALDIRTYNNLRFRATTKGQLEVFNTGGSVFIGSGAGAADDLTSNYNVFIGDNSGYGSSSGNSNIGIGRNSLFSNTSGSINTAVGVSSLYANGIGQENVAFGASSLANNTDGSWNVGIGNGALYSNTSGAANSALGFQALYSNTTNGRNTAVGYYSLYSNTAEQNCALGYYSLRANTSGEKNTGLGYYALSANTTGGNNTSVGWGSLQGNNIGEFNTSVGSQAMYSNSGGSYNVALGWDALYSNSTGVVNTAVGYYALAYATGSNNTAVGANALAATTSGEHNVSVGKQAGANNTTGSDNTCIGFYAGVNSGGLSNATAIGSGCVVDASNRVYVGNTSVSQIKGQVNFSTYSDRRIKNDIRENVPGIDFISRLRPVTYHYDIDEENRLLNIEDTYDWDGKYDIEKICFSGFIAQEVDEAANEIGYDFSGVDREGTLMSLKYAEFTVPIVKAIQEQQAMIVEMKTENETLKEQMNLYRYRMEQLENRISQRAQ